MVPAFDARDDVRDSREDAPSGRRPGDATDRGRHDPMLDCANGLARRLRLAMLGVRISERLGVGMMLGVRAMLSARCLRTRELVPREFIPQL